MLKYHQSNTQAVTMKPLHLQAFNPEPFSARRAQLARAMRAQSATGTSIAIIPTASEVVRNRDAHYQFRPDSYFYYLTGFTEPEAFLVLCVTADSARSILFCREKNLEREIWDGYRLGPDNAPEQLGVDQALSVDQLDAQLLQLLSNAQTVFAPLAYNAAFDARLSHALSATRALARSGSNAPSVQHDVYALLDEMRLRKDASEQNWMREAGKISAAGHIRAMQTCQVGWRELDLDAEIRHEFMRRGAQEVAYSSIVATGANACVLHYRAGLSELADGDLCLIDAGAEYGYYAGDITRTFPVNGRFTKSQRAVYDVVLHAQSEAIALTRAGVAFDAPHHAVVRVLTQGLLDLGILNANTVGTLDDAITQKAYLPYFMHRTGHWLGLDVHDCGAYSVGQQPDPNDAAKTLPIFRNLESGMALTIEPGLYIRPSAEVPPEFWNIGIRIEDDAIVTDLGCELMTRDVPVDAGEIELLMKSK
jgi:Xaa-Pro aminopeptidase